jgi:hypothetical protein
VVEGAEDWDRGQLTGCGGSCRSEPARASRRLGAQAAMRAAVVVANVFAQDALGVALAEEQRRSRRREKTSHPEAAEPITETRVVDAVAVVQQIASAWWGHSVATASITSCSAFEVESPWDPAHGCVVSIICRGARRS